MTMKLDGNTCSTTTANTFTHLLCLNLTVTVQHLRQCLIAGSIAMAPHTGTPMMSFPSKSMVKPSTLPRDQEESQSINSHLHRTSAYNSDHSCSTFVGL